MIYFRVHFVHAIIETEITLVVQEADNLGKGLVVIRIAGTNFSASGWAILEVVYYGNNSFFLPLVDVSISQMVK